MGAVVDLNTLVKINQALKAKGFTASLHVVGGCTCNGLQIRGKELPETILPLVNEMLLPKFMYVIQDPSKANILQVISKFE